MKAIFNIILHKPLFNLLIALILFIPGNNLGLAIVLLTLIVKFLLAPFSYKALVSQIKNNRIQPFVEKIKKDHPDNKQLQSQKQLELYQKLKVNPFSGCLPTVIQIVVVLSLYALLKDGFSFQEGLVYPFLHFPETIQMGFLGIRDISSSNIVLAILAGVFQYIQVWLSPVFKKDDKMSLKDMSNLGPMDMMQKQMGIFVKFVMPGMVIIFGLMFPATLVLYWITNTLFTIGQEIVIKSRLKSIEEDIDLRLKEYAI